LRDPDRDAHADVREGCGTGQVPRPTFAFSGA